MKNFIHKFIITVFDDIFDFLMKKIITKNVRTKSSYILTYLLMLSHNSFKAAKSGSFVS